MGMPVMQSSHRRIGHYNGCCSTWTHGCGKSTTATTTTTTTTTTQVKQQKLYTLQK